MIKINVATNSKGRAVIASGSVLNINVTIVTRKELVDGNIVVKYDVGFDSTIYENFAQWRSEINSEPIIRGEMIQYPVSYYAVDVPLESLTATALQQLYLNIIENGAPGYAGIGVGNAEIINA